MFKLDVKIIKAKKYIIPKEYSDYNRSKIIKTYCLILQNKEEMKMKLQLPKIIYIMTSIIFIYCFVTFLFFFTCQVLNGYKITIYLMF